VKLLAEEVDTKVAVLTSLSGGGDADDLAWTTLEDEKIANANVVAWDGDSVGSANRADGASLGVTWGTHSDFAVSDNNVFFTVDVDVFVSVTADTFEWVADLLGSAVETVTEGVIVAVVVVVSHVAVVFVGLFLETNSLTLGGTVSWVLAGIGRLVFPTVFLYERSGAFAELTFGNVNARVEVDVSGRSVTCVVFTVVFTVLNVDLSVGVTLERFAVAVMRMGCQ
jgi:hypothetical protein